MGREIQDRSVLVDNEGGVGGHDWLLVEPHLGELTSKIPPLQSASGWLRSGIEETRHQSISVFCGLQGREDDASSVKADETLIGREDRLGASRYGPQAQFGIPRFYLGVRTERQGEPATGLADALGLGSP
jgi:hypothetical protein